MLLIEIWTIILSDKLHFYDHNKIYRGKDVMTLAEGDVM